MSFAKSFREQAAQKYLSRGRGNQETLRITEEYGVTERTLRNWVDRCGMKPAMTPPNRRPQDWSAAEKFKAVFEFENLSEDKRGEYLRSNGLHSEHIETWKQSMKKGLEPSSAKGSATSKAEGSEDKRKIKELEREVARKDKVIVETTALLVLKKKADSIWGTGEDE